MCSSTGPLYLLSFGDLVYHYEFQVCEVYDGDTMKGVLDLGDGTYRGHPDRRKSWRSIRFLGINTPEKRGDSYEDGILVRDYVRKMLPLKTWCEVYTELDKEGGFGRLLGRVVLPSGGIDLCAHLLERGYAIEYKPSTPHPGLTDEQRAEIRAFLDS
jgi:endonuclease YncB( thermonuclease family)